MSCGSTRTTVAVGRGYRTNDAGIAQLRGLLGGGVEVVVVPLPHYRGPADVFHLMSILSPVAEDLAVVYSPLMPVPFREWLVDRGLRFVEVPDAEFESMGTNVLAVGPRRVRHALRQSGDAGAARGRGRRGVDLRRIGDQPQGWRRPDVPDKAAGARIAAAGNQRIRSVSHVFTYPRTP